MPYIPLTWPIELQLVDPEPVFRAANLGETSLAPKPAKAGVPSSQFSIATEQLYKPLFYIGLAFGMAFAYIDVKTDNETGVIYGNATNSYDSAWSDNSRCCG
jgi:hypothetical protein